MNTLSDLSRDILADMGIKIMGDVLAILKHAKNVKSSGLSSSPSPAKKASPAVNRIVGHYTKSRKPKPTPAPVWTEDDERKELRKEKFATDAVRVVPKVKRFSPYSRIGGGDQRNLKRATPEYEGSFTVKMPKGTTPKTRRLLRGLADQSVFERLGRENNNSTDERIRMNYESYGTNSMASDMQDEPVFQRLGLDGQYYSDGIVEDADGNLYRAVPVDEDEDDDQDEDNGDQLQYQGVLKTPAQRANIVHYPNTSTAQPTKPILKKSVSFAAGDNRQGNAMLNRSRAPSADLVRAVVTNSGRKIKSPLSQGIFGAGSLLKQPKSVHNRLGQKNSPMDEDGDYDEDEYGQTSTSVSTVMKKTKTVFSRPNLMITAGSGSRLTQSPKVYLTTAGLTDGSNTLLKRAQTSRTKSFSTTTTGPLTKRISLASKGDIFSRLGTKKNS